MGVFQAMQAAVTGLNGNSLALEHISGNIANSRTTGFKRTESYFVDLIPQDTATLQRSSGALAFGRGTMDVQGGLTNSYLETHMAINGDGYFTVEEPMTFRDGFPSFEDVNNYTRRGDFDLDKNGYLVNGAGYYLKGLPVDPITNNVSGTLPEIINIDTGNLSPNATSLSTYELNIPVSPTTAGASNVWDNTALGANGQALSQVAGGDEDLFLDASITGGAITVYNPNGAPLNMQFRWAMDSNDATGQTYGLYMYKNDTANDVIWEQMATAVFNNDGSLSSLNGFDQTGTGGPNYVGTAGPISDTTPVTITIPATGDGTYSITTPAGQETIIDGTTYIEGSSNTEITINLGLGGAGITNFADSDGQVTINDLGQNGYGTGEFVELSITSENRIRALYSNGISIDQAEIQLTKFNADNKLIRLDGGVFLQSSESGDPIPIYGTGGATINGSTLEDSNVDIADEFTKLIVTQQAYAANTRIVTTADEMLTEVVNMKR